MNPYITFIALALISSPFISVGEVSAKPMRLCVKSQTGEIITKRKCGKNQTQVTVDNLGSLSGSIDSVTDLSEEIGSLNNSVEGINASIGVISDSLANVSSQTNMLTTDLASLVQAVPASYFLHTDENGDVRTASSGVTIVRTSEGTYTVTFPVDLTGCYLFSTKTLDNSGTDLTSSIYINFPSGINGNEAEVRIWRNFDNDYENGAFNIGAFCP